MKRFIISVLFVSVFCIGLGAVVENVGARFKSDEKALALIKQARLAIGGDQSIAEVRSMIIKGNSTHTFKIENSTRTEQGETEIALQLPDKLSKMVKIGRHDGIEGSEKIRSEKHDVLIMHGEAKGGGEWTGKDGEKIVVRKIEGGKNLEIERAAGGKDGEFTTADGKKIILKRDGADVEDVIVRAGKGEGMARHSAVRQNELLRTTLSLLLTAPEGMDVQYTFAGEGDVDGTTCNIVNAAFGGSNIKLYLSKASSLPVMISYLGHDAPRVMMFKMKAPEGAEPAKDKVFFTHKLENPEMSEVQVRFSDHRSTGGVQLPYKWTTSVAGQINEVFDVTSYDVNPSNIADRFQNQKTFVRMKKEAN